MQSLHDIIQELPKDFIEEVMACDSVPRLREMRWETSDADKVAVIDARIANLQYLVS